MLELFHCNTSYASQKVRLFFAEYHVEYKSNHIDLRLQEQITSDYRRINPKGAVPTLKDGDEIILNSTEIMEYVLQKYLKTQYQQCRGLSGIHSFCKQHESLHDPHIRTLSYHYLFFSPEKRKSMDLERLQAISSQHPWKERGEFLMRAIKGEITQTEISQAENAIENALDNMEMLLQKNNTMFLFSDFYTMADAVGTAGLFRIDKLHMKEQIHKRGLLKEYYATMRSRPNFNAANMC